MKKLVTAALGARPVVRDSLALCSLLDMGDHWLSCGLPWLGHWRWDYAGARLARLFTGRGLALG